MLARAGWLAARLFGTTLVAAISCAGIFASDIEAPRPEPADVLSVMERVADWQLRNPGSFELRWKQSGGRPDGHLRIGWDGHVMRQFTLEPLSEGVPPPTAEWGAMTRWARGGVGIDDLPRAVQAAWHRQTGVDPALILSIELLDESGARSWEMATLYLGLSALSEHSRKSAYRIALHQAAEANRWKLGHRIYHADDHCVGLLYLGLAERTGDSRLFADVQARFDWIMRHPSAQAIDIARGQDRWTWSDALFMSPPVWVRLARLTGDRAYLQFMDREWWATTAALYSAEDGLFFRDSSYFERREKNGAPVYWSRGNGWVLASLAVMLGELPADFGSRAKYEQLFRALAARVVALQPEDGLWRSSLLDPLANPNPESSSSAFFCFALARGMRLGLLSEDTFTPVVLKTWAALQRCVRPDGHFGRVQQPGAGPGSADADSTAPYGVGAFLLAGAEIHQLLSSDRR